MNRIQQLINDARRVFGKKTLASDIQKPIKYCRRGWFYITLIVAMLGSGAARATAPVNDIQRLSLSEQHGCAITLGGALRCYGNNGQGQLGNGASGPYAKFGEQIIADGVTAVATGQQHTCAIAGGALLCWGDNSDGQIGNGKAGGIVAKPTQIIDAGVTAVAAGLNTTCAVVHGALKCWGRNNDGQVGNGTMSLYAASPTQVIASGVTAVAVGWQHTCAVVNGGLKCWGFMLNREGSGFKTLLEPTTFIADGVTAVIASMHTCAVVKGALQCWGRNFNGQVGIGDPSVAASIPTEVIAGGVTDVVTNDKNTCAIVQAALYCWGSNNSWQLGAKTPLRYDEPHQLLPRGVSAVAVGMNTVCAVVDGILQCTNRAPDNEQPPQDWLGFGTNSTPFAVPEPELPRLVRYGLWRGTIGKQNVMVLLEPKDCDSSYYYLKYLWGITLFEKDKRGQVWEEYGDGLATWKFENATEDTLSGQWTDGEGKRSVPIRLKRVAVGTGEENKCGMLNKKFEAPRIAAQKPTVAEADFDKHRYRTVSVLAGAIKGVEVLDDDNPLPNLNQRMRNWLWANVSGYYECQTMQGSRLDMRNSVPDFFEEMTPVFWNEQGLVLRETYSAYCGGAHPSGGIASYLVWDLIEDKAIEPWDWIRGSKGKYGGHVAPEKLNRLIHAIAASKRDDDCAEVVRSNAYYLVYPGKTGMVFSPTLAHVVQACADDIEVPYAKLRPYLTSKGEAAIKLFLEGR